MDAIKEGMLASAKAADAAARIGERLFCQNTPNVMNFNSQICTSRDQSERLLALGLKKETSDCYWFYCDIAKEWKCTILSSTQVFKDYPTTVIPAWSLDRLRELIPENIFTGIRNQWHRVMYNGILTYEEGDDSLVSFREANIYDRCISCIEWLIKEGYLKGVFEK